MLSKFGIVITILVLVFIFFIVISFGAGAFSKDKVKPEIKKYLKSVNILLTIIAIVGIILVLFLWFYETSDLHHSINESLNK